MSHLRRKYMVAAALAACTLGTTVSGQKFEIKTNQADKTDFKAFKTYAWLPPVAMVRNVAPDAVSNPTLSEEALAPALVAAIERELAARGITKAPFDTADLHVASLAGARCPRRRGCSQPTTMPRRVTPIPTSAGADGLRLGIVAVSA